MTDFEIVKMSIGGMPLEEMTSITFLGWVAKKINGLEQNSPIMNELAMLVKNPPLGKMSIENKLEVIRKLEKLGVEIV